MKYLTALEAWNGAEKSLRVFYPPTEHTGHLPLGQFQQFIFTRCRTLQLIA